MLTNSPERDLYQGLLQIGLAYYQINRGNYRGALKMFQRGHRNLDPLGHCLLGIDLVQLREDAQRVENALRQLGPEGIDQLDIKSIQGIPEIQPGKG
jgi:predicted metal-dependent hydrolase